MPILNVDNPANWNKIFDVTLDAAVVLLAPPRHIPIPNFNFPDLVDRRTLAVGCASAAAKPTWRLGFWLKSLVRIPGIGNAVCSSSAIYLGLNLIRLPPIASEFRLQAQIPKWHSNLQIEIWKYIGVEADD